MDTFTDIWTALKSSEKALMAVRLETSVPYLSQLAHGHRSPGKAFARAIEIDTRRTRQQLFPEKFPEVA